jgi:uncharacterized membrane protein YkvA (DUF1232 family)
LNFPRQKTGQPNERSSKSQRIRDQTPLDSLSINPHPDMTKQNYAAEFTEESFWQKLARGAATAGRTIVEKSLTMYFAAMDEDTPVWAKTVLVGALGYFICPIDAIPDVIPVGGYGDDAGAIAAALALVAAHIKAEHRDRASKRAQVWFA